MDSGKNQGKDLSFRGTIQENPEGADGVAWAVFQAKGDLQKVYIKHPQLGVNEIRIKVLYSGICQSDVSMIKDIIPGMTVFPIIAGHEIIGKVYALGKNVTSLKEGDVVGIGPFRDCCEKCDYCQTGFDNLCEGLPYRLTINPFFGGFSTSVQLPVTCAFKIPDGIPLESAPALMCAGGTVWNPINKWRRNGSKVAVLGIGGLGHLAVQFASKMGMKTYAVSTSNSKKDAIMKLGAHEYVNSNDPDEFAKFHQQKIDIILNTTSSGDAQSYMKALRKGTGVFVQIGGPESEFKLNPIECLRKELTYTGSAAASRNDMKQMLEFSNLNKVKPVVELFNFEDFPKAYERIKTGKPEFRVVVDVQSYNWN